MRPARWAILGVASLVVLVSSAPASGSGPPPDLAAHWARAEIGSLLRIGAIGGFPDGSFRPDDTITKAQFVRLLTAALRITLTDSAAPFAGMRSHWAESACSAAVSADILRIEDYPDGFSPDSPLSRLEFATMLVRAGGLSGGSPVGFSDLALVDEERLRHVWAVADAGLVTGFPDGTFRPGNPATRAEAAVTVVRLLNLRASISPSAADFALASELMRHDSGRHCALFSGTGHAIVFSTDRTCGPSLALALDGRLVSASGVFEHPAYADGRLTHVLPPYAGDTFPQGLYLTSWELEFTDDGQDRDHLPSCARMIDLIAKKTPGMVIESGIWRGMELPGGHQILWSGAESRFLLVLTEYGGAIDGLVYPLFEPGRFTRVPAGMAAFGLTWEHDVYVLPFLL